MRLFKRAIFLRKRPEIVEKKNGFIVKYFVRRIKRFKIRFIKNKPEIQRRFILLKGKRKLRYKIVLPYTRKRRVAARPRFVYKYVFHFYCYISDSPEGRNFLGWHSIIRYFPFKLTLKRVKKQLVYRAHYSQSYRGRHEILRYHVRYLRKIPQTG